MFGSDRKMISGRQQPSSPLSRPRPQRRPPSTPPLPVRALQLVAKQPETPVVLRDGRKVRGHGSGVRESWPGTGLTTFDPNPRMSQRSVTPPSRAQPVTEVQTRTSNQSRLRAPPPPPDQNPLLPSGWSSEATMMSLLLFCHSTSSHSLVALDNRIEQVLDLVKSHLMLAVREEVELLRERIRELQEKNQHLERENHILRTLTHNIHTT